MFLVIFSRARLGWALPPIRATFPQSVQLFPTPHAGSIGTKTEGAENDRCQCTGKEDPCTEGCALEETFLVALFQKTAVIRSVV